MHHEFEVNLIEPLLLTQGIAKQMLKRGKGRIVCASSREGLNVNPFTGIYSASKHAAEAVAEQEGKRRARQATSEFREVI